MTYCRLRKRDRTVYEFSLPDPSFSLILFYESFCSDASQRSGRGKSAPCSHSSLQMSLGCTQMNSTQSSYFTPTREKHAKPDLWSSSMALRPNTRNTASSKHLCSWEFPRSVYSAQQYCIGLEWRNYTKCGKKNLILHQGKLNVLVLYGGLMSYNETSLLGFFFGSYLPFTAFQFKTLILLWNHLHELLMVFSNRCVRNQRTKEVGYIYSVDVQV